MTDSEMQKFQKSCGTRVLLDGKSCITTISDKTFYDKMNASKTALHGIQCQTTGKNDANKILSGSKIH